MWRTSSTEFLSYQPNSSMSAVAVIVQRRRTLWRPQKCSLAQQDAEKSWTVAWLPVLWRRWPFCWAAESLRDLESRRSSHSANHQLCARQSSRFVSAPLRRRRISAAIPRPFSHPPPGLSARGNGTQEPTSVLSFPALLPPKLLLRLATHIYRRPAR